MRHQREGLPAEGATEAVREARTQVDGHACLRADGAVTCHEVRVGKRPHKVPAFERRRSQALSERKKSPPLFRGRRAGGRDDQPVEEPRLRVKPLAVAVAVEVASRARGEAEEERAVAAGLDLYSSVSK